MGLIYVTYAESVNGIIGVDITDIHGIHPDSQARC
jgi:hypothetical protein